MKWHDLLYFSKGERRALTLLLSLIAAAWLILICTHPEAEETQQSQSPLTHMTNKTSQTPDTIRINPGKRQSKPHPVQPTIDPPRKKTDTLFKPFRKTEKFQPGTIVELNTADTTILKKIPGIGSTFARRIIKYRDLLGGFYTVEQLAEVYGIDEERYNAMKSWFSIDLSAISQLSVNQLSAKKLACHPYVSYKQARAIEHLVHQKGKLTGWENLSLLEEFSEFDHQRLNPYLSFE